MLTIDKQYIEDNLHDYLPLIYFPKNNNEVLTARAFLKVMINNYKLHKDKLLKEFYNIISVVVNNGKLDKDFGFHIYVLLIFAHVKDTSVFNTVLGILQFNQQQSDTWQFEKLFTYMVINSLFDGKKESQDQLLAMLFSNNIIHEHKHSIISSLTHLTQSNLIKRQAVIDCLMTLFKEIAHNQDEEVIHTTLNIGCTVSSLQIEELKEDILKLYDSNHFPSDTFYGKTAFLNSWQSKEKEDAILHSLDQTPWLVTKEAVDDLTMNFLSSLKSTVDSTGFQYLNKEDQEGMKNFINSTVGNDIMCPCASGKKFKDCCM